VFDQASIVKAAVTSERDSKRHTRYLMGFAFVCVLAIVTAVIYSLSAIASVLISGLVFLCLFLAWQLRLFMQRAQTLETTTATLDALAEIYWDWDLQTSVFTYRGPLTSLLGYPDDTEPDPAFWKQVIHPVDRPMQKYHLLRHLGDESEPYYYEYRLRDHSDGYQWFAGRGKIVSRGTNGQALYMVGSLEHIQRRKDLEQNLVHAQKMEALGQLTGGIAHDFNNVLASIMGYTELALESPEDERVGFYLEQIHQAGSRAKNVVRQLLDFSRPSRSEIQVVNLQHEIKQAIQMLRSTIPATIEISQTFPDQNCPTRLDPDQLQRVLLNLCINARDAMNNKGHLAVQLKTQKSFNGICSSCQLSFEGNFHVIRIKDSGEGIPVDIHSKLFEPFFTTKDFGKGTGMGLSVVHGIVHESSGHIQITSESGAGTEFSLYLPCLQVHAKVDDSPENADHKNDIRLTQNILIIDDDESVASFLYELLEKHGCYVEVTNTPKNALTIIREKRVNYDLIVSDQTMPGLTGTEFATVLMDVDPKIPILLYSASALERKDCPENVLQILSKPIDNKKLLKTISSLPSGDKPRDC
jgi:signal transduction histidine kinase